MTHLSSQLHKKSKQSWLTWSVTSKRFLNTCVLVKFLDNGICVYRARSVTSSAKKRSFTCFDANFFSKTIIEVVCQSRASLVPMKYQKRKHFHS